MILDQIVRNKKKEIAHLKKNIQLSALAGFLKKRKKIGAFYKALSSARDIAVIAEIKRKSPSKGILRQNFKPIEIARDFQKSGASALSVLTDEKFFGGSLAVLKKVRAATQLPILRKDFMLEECQVYEAALAGADAILLIAAILKPAELSRFSRLAATLGLDVVFEVHDAKDVKKVLPLKPRIVGINNRDLRTFEVSLTATERLSKYFSKSALLISESGIFTRQDIDRVKKAGAKAVLVGESLMKQARPGKALKTLLESK